MGKGQEDTPRQLTQIFAETTSMHGVSRIVRKPGLFRKCFWIIAVLGGAGVSSYNIWKIGAAYSRWEVATVVTLEYNSKLAFPSLSICNLNPVKLSEFLNNSELTGVRRALGQEEGYQNFTNDEEFPDWETQTHSPDYYDQSDEDFQARINFRDEVAKLSRRTRVQIGHRIQDMLLECSFHGRPCTPKNFTRFYNYMHGNCYNFNPVDSHKDITRTGPLYGLSLTLYAEDMEYISSLSDSVGFKVLVHSTAAMPFPEDEGFDIAPGFETSVGVTKVVVERAPAPYGECLQYGTGAELPANIFVTELKGLGYSDRSCEKTCLQRLLINECDCCDSGFPCGLEARNLIIEDSPSSIEFCEFHSKKSKCATEILEEFQNGLSSCGADCLPNCSDETHQLEISTSRWPSSGKVQDLAGAIIAASRRRGQKIDINDESSDDEKTDFIRQNTLKLDVFYKQLNYEKIETKPAYDWSRLLSDVGGQAGLWLGLSLLTLGEILELLLDIAIGFFKRCCRREIKPIKSIH